MMNTNGLPGVTTYAVSRQLQPTRSIAHHTGDCIMSVKTWSFRKIAASLFTLIAVFGLGAGNAHASLFDMGMKLLEKTAESNGTSATLNTEEIGSGLKEALKVGTGRVVGQLGKPDGFNADPDIHIPLPGSLLTARNMLQQVGMGGMLNDLELRLNRAAEAATPKAKALFMQAINDMSLEDVEAIYNGPEDAATRYFEKKMSPALAIEMRPVVEQSLADVGAVQSYELVMGQYRALPYAPDIKTDLSGYVVNKGMAGIFHYLALEEAAIRKDPAKRTTDLLRRVFGAQ
jgi:hypothetical protein